MMMYDRRMQVLSMSSNFSVTWVFILFRYKEAEENDFFIFTISTVSMK